MHFEVYQLTAALLSSLGLYVGWRGLTTRRPVVLRVRWLAGALAIIALPELVAITMGPASPHSRLGIGLGVLLTVAFSGVPWLGLGANVVLGATPAGFAEALQHALGRLGLQHEQRGTSYFATNEAFVLETSIQALVGTAKVDTNEWRGKRWLGPLSSEMAAYFSVTPVEVNRTIFRYCIAVAVSLMALAMVSALMA